MSWDRKEDRESAQKKFDDACAAAKLSPEEKGAFGRYMHDQGLLRDYMSYQEIRDLAVEWKGRSGYNPYHSRNR